MLWNDIKGAIHPRRPKDCFELKQFCEEECFQQNFIKTCFMFNGVFMLVEQTKQNLRQ